jgi:hypothetical protein
MHLPKQTADIYEILRKGKFICANSTKTAIRNLYDLIRQEENKNLLASYFDHINYQLCEGDGYFYFSRQEDNTTIEKKLERFEKYIDILDFFKHFDPGFSTGTRFSPSHIAEECKANKVLKDKLMNISTQRKGENLVDMIRNIADEMDIFMEREDDETEIYLVLDSFKYLETLVFDLSIDEDDE